MAPADVRPFTIDVPQADLDDLRARLERTRWAAEQPHDAPASSGVPVGEEYGFPVSRLRTLVGYWLDRYDWRKQEAALNAYPQFVTDGEMDELTADEQAALSVLSWFWERKGAFNTLHSQQPQTLAHAITDSPAGLLAWNGQLFDGSLDHDFVLTNVALYWLTGTSCSSIRFYYEDAHAPRPAKPTTVPIALAAAADGDFKSIRRFAERDHANIASWHVLPGVTGHYAAHTNPAALAADIRSFFAGLS